MRCIRRSPGLSYFPHVSRKNYNGESLVTQAGLLVRIWISWLLLRSLYSSYLPAVTFRTRSSLRLALPFLRTFPKSPRVLRPTTDLQNLILRLVSLRISRTLAFVWKARGYPALPYCLRPEIDSRLLYPRDRRSGPFRYSEVSFILKYPRREGRTRAILAQRRIAVGRPTKYETRSDRSGETMRGIKRRIEQRNGRRSLDLNRSAIDLLKRRVGR